jgi:hypothetical protein
LASPDFMLILPNAPVHSKCGSKLHCLLDSTPVTSWICLSLILNLVTPHSYPML